MGGLKSRLFLEWLHITLLVSIQLGCQKPWVCSTVQCDVCILLTFESPHVDATFSFYSGLNKLPPKDFIFKF